MDIQLGRSFCHLLSELKTSFSVQVWQKILPKHVQFSSSTQLPSSIVKPEVRYRVYLLWLSSVPQQPSCHFQTVLIQNHTD